MPGIRITSFGGLLPAISEKTIPEINASVAVNTKLWNGKLRPFPTPVMFTPWQGFSNNFNFHPKRNGIYFSPSHSDYPELDTNFDSPTVYQFDYDTPVSGVDIQTMPEGRVIYQSEFAKDVLYQISSGSPSRKLGIPAGPFILNTAVTSFAPPPRHPVARCYCATAVDNLGAEGRPYFPAEINDLVAEGDTVEINLSFPLQYVQTHGISFIRLYRTVTTFETGETINNAFDTTWHLVAELKISDFIPSGGSYLFTYIDSNPADRNPNDLLLTEDYVGPLTGFPVATNGGWLAVVNPFGRVQVSERYQWHAFPHKNEVTIPNKICSAVSFFDDIYVTCTDGSPYRISVDQNAETGADVKVYKYSDFYKSVDARSLVSTNFGCMFSSTEGLIAVSGDKITNTTKNLINADDWDLVYKPSSSVWANGVYIGYREVDAKHTLYDFKDLTNDQYELSKLVELEFGLIESKMPMRFYDNHVYFKASDWVYAWDGLFKTYKNPAVNLFYTWRSKKFVFPAVTTFAAAKVVFLPGTGDVTFTLIGDGRIIMQHVPLDSNPFRLPHNHKCIEWEIELSGTAWVDEVHVSTSMTELSEGGSK